MQKNPQPFSDYAKSGIISAVAEQDPQHAFRLIGQLDLKDKNQTAWQIVNSAKTFDQKSATLAGLREYLPTLQTGDSLDHYGKSYLSMLAADMHREGIDAITRWISESKLTPQELDPFLDGLANATQSDETGRWIEWMRQSLPTEQADRRIDNLIHQWASRDYQAAAQWANTQPEGKDREQVLKTILRYWPEQDPVGREAFAKSTGSNSRSARRSARADGGFSSANAVRSSSVAFEEEELRATWSKASICRGWEQSFQHSGRLARNPLALGARALQSAAHQGGLAELVDALDSKSSSNECGFESHSRYFSFSAGRPVFFPTHTAWPHPRTIGIIAGSGVYPETFMPPRGGNLPA